MNKAEINDRVVRFIGIPFFGCLIPNATGLVDNTALNGWQMALTYVWFVFGAGSIWEGNRIFLFRNIGRGDWLVSPFRRLFNLLGLITIYTLIIATLELWLWDYLMPPDGVNWQAIVASVTTIFVCVIFITSAYELIYQVKLKENEKVKAEQLERAKIQAELEALKSHIDPHFMFNSLNLVSFLIDNHPQRARVFIDHLSDVYRYILQSKTKDLVLLGEEMEVTRKYFHLLELRFENALDLYLEWDAASAYKFLIPPISVMMAIENAVKHNEASEERKLKIRIIQNGDKVRVSNNLAEKKNIRHSNKTGLTNLDERFKRIIGQNVEIVRTDTEFTLGLPLLPLTAS